MSTSLQPGSTLSHYRVISPLGAGGMGEVYLALDESLERSVALKILPPELVRNEERVRRFIQEAKSASSLSHPNIVTIYEIGQAEVSSDGAAGASPIHFIAMELVAGETLKHKIHLEKTDLHTLVGYLAQAAEGLAKAHAAGIVHRDLKPENVMISKDGFVKVLDFGLAKLIERQESPADMTSLPTTAGEPTREGVVLGTVGYMSPEQVKGRGVDHRSDVFSFGCLLYEAATRRKPFSADTDVETMHRILNDRPAPIEELNPAVPAALRRLTRRCLAKNADQRFQSMKDVALELAEIAEEYEQLSASDSSGSLSGSTFTPSAPARSRGLPLWATAGIAILAAAAIAFVVLRPKAPARLVTLEKMKFTRVTTSGDIQQAALSADGRYLAHVRRQQGKYSLWVRQVATGSDVRIVDPLPTPFRGVSFSRDGNYVYYVNQETSGPGYAVLYQVPVLGGTARKLVFDIDSAAEPSPDGQQLAFTRGYPQRNQAALMIAEATGSGERALVTLTGPSTFDLKTPAWSPDGERIVAIENSVQGGLHNRLVTIRVRDTSRTEIGTKRWDAINDVAWLPDGTGLVLTGNDEPGTPAQLWFVSYPRGEAARITNDLNRYAGISPSGDSRSLATAQFDFSSNVWVASANDASDARQITFGSGSEDAIAVVVVTRGGGLVLQADDGNEGHIWSASAEGSNRVRLTPRGTRNFGPMVPRDADMIFFTSRREDGLPHVWRMDADGGNQVQITKGTGELGVGVSPDGQWVAYVMFESGQLWKIPAQGGDPVKFGGRLVNAAAGFSPDGRQFAHDTYVEGTGGRLERMVVIVSADGGPATQTFPFPNGITLVWHPSGDALTYILTVDGVDNVWLQPNAGGAPRQLTHFTSGELFGFSWTSDGKQLYLSRGQTRSDVVLIEGFH